MKAPVVEASYFIVMVTLKLDRIPCRKGKCQEVSVCLVEGERRVPEAELHFRPEAHIYIPLYAKTVVRTEAYSRLVALRDSGKNLMLIDFDGYNLHHPHYGLTYNDVVHCPLLKMGHGFVLAMLLEGLIHGDDNGEVEYVAGLMDDPHREYSSDLRNLTEGQKLERGAKAAGVTVAELEGLSASDRTLLRVASRKENIYARGFSKAAWKRLPMAEKFAILKEKK